MSSHSASLTNKTPLIDPVSIAGLLRLERFSPIISIPMELWTRILIHFVVSQDTLKKRYNATRIARSVCGLWLHIVDNNIVFNTTYYLKTIENHGIVVPLYRPTELSESIQKIGNRGLEVALEMLHMYEYQVVVADTYLRPVYDVSSQWHKLDIYMECRLWRGQLKKALEAAHSLRQLTITSVDPINCNRPYRLLNMLDRTTEINLYSLQTLKIEGRLNHMPLLFASNLITLELCSVEIDLDDYCRMQSGLSRSVSLPLGIPL